jgi:hypothetical protein
MWVFTSNMLRAAPLFLLLLLLLLLLQVLQLAVDTLRPNIVEVALDLIHKLIAFRCDTPGAIMHHRNAAAHAQEQGMHGQCARCASNAGNA